MLHARRYQEAIVALERVITPLPRLPEAYVNLGYALLGLERMIPRAIFPRRDRAAAFPGQCYWGLAGKLEALSDLRGLMRDAHLHPSRPPDDPFVRARSALWEGIRSLPAVPAGTERRWIEQTREWVDRNLPDRDAPPAQNLAIPSGAGPMQDTIDERREPGAWCHSPGRRRISALLHSAAILMLALWCGALAWAQPGHGGLIPGTSYRELAEAQSVEAAPGTVEVIEFLWYDCQTCFVVEPALERWAQSREGDVTLRRLPAMIGSHMAYYARAFFAAEALGVFDRIHLPLYQRTAPSWPCAGSRRRSRRFLRRARRRSRAFPQ